MSCVYITTHLTGQVSTWREYFKVGMGLGRLKMDWGRLEWWESWDRTGKVGMVGRLEWWESWNGTGKDIILLAWDWCNVIEQDWKTDILCVDMKTYPKQTRTNRPLHFPSFYRSTQTSCVNRNTKCHLTIRFGGGGGGKRSATSGRGQYWPPTPPHPSWICFVSTLANSFHQRNLYPAVE